MILLVNLEVVYDKRIMMAYSILFPGLWPGAERGIAVPGWDDLKAFEIALQVRL